MIILDTNVVSETMKPVPEPRVIDWLNRQELSTLHLTTVSLAELRFGMARLEPGRRRDDFELRLERMLTEVFPGRVLGFDAAAANAFGALVALAEARLAGEATDLAAYRAVLAGLLDQPGGERIDTVVNACTHFPLVEDELAAAAPRPLRFVDGGAGIARRIAHLTAGQPWPVSRGPGRAVFTRFDDAVRALIPALSRYGLTAVEPF